MKLLLTLVAALAMTLGTAAAQSTPASTSSRKSSTKPGKVVVSSGGQGHNSGADPKGKVLVAPSTSAPKGKSARQ